MRIVEWLVLLDILTFLVMVGLGIWTVWDWLHWRLALVKMMMIGILCSFIMGIGGLIVLLIAMGW